MNGPTEGTPIQDLLNQKKIPDINNQQNMMNTHHISNTGLAHEQGHNASHNVVTAGHAPYNNILDNPEYPQHTQQCSGQARKQRKVKQDLQDIDALAQEISDNLPSDILLTGVSDTPIKEDTPDKKDILSKIPKCLLESAIIIIIFIVLSQPFVKNLVGKYIKYINPNTDGNVPFVGILIYGTIFAVLYCLIKKALFTYVL